MCKPDTGKVVELEEGVRGMGCQKAEEPANEPAEPQQDPAPSEEPVAEMAGKRKSFFVEAMVKANGVNSGARTVEGWASVEEVDRGGDVMLATAFDQMIDRFKRNPVLCWCHNIFQPPIGCVTNLEVVPGKGLRFTAKFANTKFAQEVFQLFRDRALRAFSVQFIPHSVRPPSQEESVKFAGVKQIIEKAELLEISPVPVPAVASALVGKSKSLNLNQWQEFTLGMFARKDNAPDPNNPDNDPPPVPEKGGKKNLRPVLEAIGELAAQIAEAANAGLEALSEETPPADAPLPEGDPEPGPNDEPTVEEEASLEIAVGELTQVSKSVQDRLGGSTAPGA